MAYGYKTYTRDNDPDIERLLQVLLHSLDDNDLFLECKIRDVAGKDIYVKLTMEIESELGFAHRGYFKACRRGRVKVPKEMAVRAPKAQPMIEDKRSEESVVVPIANKEPEKVEG
jgi:hypothetical protein